MTLRQLWLIPTGDNIERDSSSFAAERPRRLTLPLFFLCRYLSV